MEKGDRKPVSKFDEDSIDSGDFVKSLPPVVRKRINALKKLHYLYSLEEAKYHKIAHQLECDFYKKYQEIFDKRKDIINGDREPAEEECKWPSDDETSEITNKIENTTLADVKGIPDFWLTAMQNADIIGELIEDPDIPVLKHLKDIKIVMKEDPIGFSIEFYFEPNEYFTNTVLTKTYEFQCEVHENDSLLFEGPDARKCEGTVINWNPGKNITVRSIKKRQKHKTTGQTKIINKDMKVDSFFNFFDTHDIPQDIAAEDMDDDVCQVVADDVEIGNYFRERIVPRAVYFFTGYYSAVDDEDLSEDEELESAETEDE